MRLRSIFLTSKRHLAHFRLQKTEFDVKNLHFKTKLSHEPLMVVRRTEVALSKQAIWDTVSTTAIFRSFHHISCDVGRPGLARTSYIQVYKTLRRRWFLIVPGRGVDEHEKTVQVGRSCWFVASCFRENGLRIISENRSRPDTTTLRDYLTSGRSPMKRAFLIATASWR